MQVIVKTIGIFREHFGTEKIIEINAPPYTVGHLLDILKEIYGVDFAHLVMPPEGEDSGILLMVNGRNISSQNGLETLLSDGSKVYFTIMMSGG